MELWRKLITSKLLKLALALHLLNVSIDPPDADPHNTTEDLSVNEVESIAEMILEHSLDLENCIPEHDDHDDYHKQHSSLRHLSEMIVSQTNIGNARFGSLLSIKYFLFDVTDNDLYRNRISTPPPKA